MNSELYNNEIFKKTYKNGRLKIDNNRPNTGERYTQQILDFSNRPHTEEGYRRPISSYSNKFNTS